MINRILVLSDHPRIRNSLKLYFCVAYPELDVAYGCSPGSTGDEEEIDLANPVEDLADRFDLIISAHCKQIFPNELVSRVRCINIHPGYNPVTRGWYPQVWAILLGLKAGVTVHVMDAKIDHGSIIHREEVPVRFSDTSKSLYDRILEAEIASLPKWLPQVLEEQAAIFEPEQEGNYFSRADFRELCAIDLEKRGTFREFYDLLRAASFPPFRNSFITDPETGKRIFLRLDVDPENS